MIYLRSFLFQLVFWLWSATMAILMLATIPLPRAVNRACLTFWSKGVILTLRWLAGVRIEIRGRENVPTGAALVAAKHQSMFDVFSQFAILSVAVLVLVVLLTTALVRSSFGRNLRAIRDSESAAASFGKNVPMIKTISVVISAGLAALAGALYASYLSFINVESFTLDTSVLIMAMVIIGGTGTVAGPIVGAAILLILPSVISYFEFLPQTEIGSLQQIIYGLGMTLLMIFRPGGLVGRRPGR